MAQFTAAGQKSNVIIAGLRDTIDISLDDGAGTFSGTIELQGSGDNFQTYEVIRSWTANADATFQHQDSELLFLRLACTAYSGNAMTYTFEKTKDVLDKPRFHQHYITDKKGRVAMEFTGDGVDIKNGLTVDGVDVGSGGSTVIQPTGVAATDTATLQERLDAHAAGEDLTPIVLGAGTFVIDAPLTYEWSSTNWPMPIIQGAGKYATLIQHEATAGGPAFTFEPNATYTFGFGVLFQDLGLRGPSVATPNRHSGLLIRSCWEGTFQRLSIQDFDGYGIRINSDGAGDPYSSKTIAIEDCNADNIGEWAIDLGATSLVTSRVIGNYLSSVGGGIWSKMQSGVIEGNGIAYTTLFEGIRIDSRGGANSRITTVRNNAFEGCAKGDITTYGVITHFQGNQHVDLLSSTQVPGDMFGYRAGFSFDAFSGTADSISAPVSKKQTITDASALFTSSMVGSTFHIAPSLAGTVGTTNATSHIITDYVSPTQIKIFNPEGTAYSAAAFAYSLGSGVTGCHIEDYTFVISGSYETATSISAPGTGNKQTLAISGLRAAFYASIVGQSVVVSGSPNATNNGTFTVTDWVDSYTIKYVNATGVSESSAGTRIRPSGNGMNRARTYDAFRTGNSTDNAGVKIGQGYFQIFYGDDTNLTKFTYGSNAAPREIDHYYGRALGPAKANYAGGIIAGGTSITPDLREATTFSYTINSSAASGLTINDPIPTPPYGGAEVILRLQSTDPSQAQVPITWGSKYFAQVGELPSFIPYSSVLWLKFEYYKAGDYFILLERKSPGTTTGLSSVTHKRYAAYLTNTDSFTPDTSIANYFRVDITTATGNVFTINNPDNPPSNPGEELIFRVANSTSNPVRIVLDNAYSPGSYDYLQLAPSTYAHFFFRRNLSFLNWYLESYVPSTGPIRGTLSTLVTSPITASSVTPVYPTYQHYHLQAATSGPTPSTFTINAPTFPPDNNSAFIGQRGHIIQFVIQNTDVSPWTLAWSAYYEFGAYTKPTTLATSSTMFLEFEHNYRSTTWRLTKYWRSDTNISFANDVTVTGTLTVGGTAVSTAVESVEDSYSANPGGGLGSATAVSKVHNFVTTCVSDHDSVVLTDGAAGLRMTVTNKTTKICDVYGDGGTEIDSLGSSNPFALGAGQSQTFIKREDGNKWYTEGNLSSLTLTSNLSVAGTAAITGVATLTAAPVLSALTASQAVFTNGSKALVSNAITGSGNVVMSASPTLTGTITAADVTASGTVTGATLVATGFIRGGYTNSITAYATGGQANATQIANRWNMVTTCATSGDSVKLPASPTAGDEVFIRNRGAAPLAIYPGSGDTIGELSANAPFYLHMDCTMGFVAESASAWRFISSSMKYIDRGDTSAVDLAHGSMTLDANYNNWDVTSIVPISCYNHGCPIVATIRLQATAVAEAYLRKDGFSNAINMIICRTQVANDASAAAQGIVVASTSGILEYRMPTTTTTSSLRIHGYWVYSM